jgi:hypothetical protein
MILTNDLSLPEAIVRAVKADPYSKGDADFSITELLKPARQRALQIKHEAELKEDVKDRLWSLYGQVAHTILERANLADLAEKRFFTSIRGADDKVYRISGQLDSLSIESETLTDYKFTTSYGFVTGRPPKAEWCQQLNMQLWLLKTNGHHAKKLQIVGLLRDWQIREANKSMQYPQAPIAIHNIDVWQTHEVEQFIKNRISAHTVALKELPQCSKEETWSGRRCPSYCNISSYCDQYKGE